MRFDCSRYHGWQEFIERGKMLLNRTVTLLSLLALLLLLSMSLVCGCQGGGLVSIATQEISAELKPAPVGGESVIEYSRLLEAGDEVHGSANVAGDWEVPGDSATPWTFELTDPDGNMLDNATIRFIPFDAENPFHDFATKVRASGKYTIRVIHHSIMVRYLSMTISPAGWQRITS
jgi:hypothetical protein